MRKLFALLLVLVPCAALVAFGPALLGHALFALGFRGEGARLMGDAGWRGYTLAREGRYIEAAAVFGDKPAFAYDRGNALVRAGRYDDALDAYDDALAADPEDADARYNRALIAKLLDKKILAPGQAGGNANAMGRHSHIHGDNNNKDSESNSLGNGYVGNQEASSTSGTQGSSSVAKLSNGGNQATDSSSLKASGSAGVASGAGRTGGDLADITQQLALNQRRYAPMFVAKVLEPNTQWLETVPDDPGSFLKLQIRAERKRRQAQDDQASGGDE